MKWQDYSFHPTWLFHVLAHSPVSIMFSRCQLLFPVGSLQLVQEGWTKTCLGLYCAVALSSLRYYQPRSLGMPWHLSPCLRSPGSFPTSSIFLSVMIFAIFSPGPFFYPLRSCLLVRDPYFWPSLISRTLNSGFPFYGVCAEGQHMIRLLICGSVSCLFINWRIWSVLLLLVQVLSKYATSPFLVQLSGSSRLLLEIPQVRFWMFIYTLTYTQLSTAC